MNELMMLIHTKSLLLKTVYFDFIEFCGLYCMIKFKALVLCEYTCFLIKDNLFSSRNTFMDALLKQIYFAPEELRFRIEDEFTFPFSISIASEKDLPSVVKTQLLDGDSSLDSLNIVEKKYLVFSAEAFFSEKQYKNCLQDKDGNRGTHGFSDDALIQMYQSMIVDTLSRYTFLFGLAASIAVPGSYQINKRYLFCDDNLIKIQGGMLNPFEVVPEIVKKYKWPCLIEISVFEVWKWLLKIPGFEIGETKNKLGRAIGALSYLMGNFKDSNELALVWVVIGLESLYGNGEFGLKQQIMEKTESFLGERDAHKRDFGKMYDTRSRLLHGDRNFSYKGFGDLFGKNYKELIDSEGIALAALIGTLQKMCNQDIDELKFKLVAEI